MSKKWREPDDSASGYAIWYGPGDDPESATEVEQTSGGWRVTEYQALGGYVDDPDLQDSFSKISTYVSFHDFAKAIGADQDLIDEEPDEWIRQVVGYGVNEIQERGGDESIVEEIP